MRIAMLADMRIGGRLALGFGMVLFVTLVIGVVGLYNLTYFSAQVAHLGAKNTQGAAYLADAQSAIWQLRWDVAQYIAVSDPVERRSLMNNGPAQARIVDENLQRFQDARRTPEEIAVLNEVREAFGNYMATRPKWFQLYGESRFEEAAAWRAKTITTYGGQTVRAFARLIALQRQTSASAEQAAIAQIQAPRNTLIALLAAALGIGGFIAFLITRSITRPLAAAVAVAQQVAAGNLAIAIESRAGDETGRLLAALGSMRDALGQAVGTIRRSAERVGTVAREIASGNAEMSSRTEQQAASLEETASSMEELTTTVKGNADNARQANELAIGASGVAGEGGTAMARVIATMEDIAESSRRIGDIIAVIDSIAFQTNILALNAAVEAARAGDQGRGFAVVASEVRTLAQRSGEAAREIRRLIAESVARVDGGTELVHGAGRTMAQIVGAVKRVTDIMGDIAAASREQLAGIEQVGHAVSQMDRVTQQNAALVEESAASAASMATQAAQLVEAVARFRLEAGADGGGAALPAPAPMDAAHASHHTARHEDFAPRLGGVLGRPAALPGVAR